MKKIRIWAIIPLYILSIGLFAACGAKATSPYTPRQISEVIIAALNESPDLYPLYPGDENYDTYLSDIYLLSQVAPDDGVVYYAGGIEACEIAVFRYGESTDAEAAEKLLQDYKERRAAAFTGYAPEQAALAEQGNVARRGAYVALLLCENPESALSTFNSCFSDKPPALPDVAELSRIVKSTEQNETDAAAGTAADEVAGALATRQDGTVVAAAEQTTAPRTQTGQTTAGQTSTERATAGTTAGKTTSAPATEQARTTQTTQAATEQTQATTEQTQATQTAQPTSGRTNGEQTATGQTTAEQTTSRQSETEEATSEQTTAEQTVAEQTSAPVSETEPVTEPQVTVAAVLSGDTQTTSPASEEQTQQSDATGANLTPAEAEYSLAADLFDPDSILAAWRSGDWSGLTYKNSTILISCNNVINEVVVYGMTEYDMELAIHDWIIQWGDYDREAISNAPDAKPDPDNDNPYGLMVNKNAICKGYTTTFQLFMDMIGIECITVEGTARQGVEPHAWNMVRLDGEWYCVDVTWNDPIGTRNINAVYYHRYFNVTSQFLRDNDHQWDESTAPEATADKYAWRPVS